VSAEPEYGCSAAGCTPCSLPNAVNACKAGACAVAACLGKYEDCNRIADDGCETDLFHDPFHCGSCIAAPCTVANGRPDCASGLCAIRSCDTGFGNCNEKVADGCETNLQNDALNCGACSKVCPGSMTCRGGFCH
jgi:hypothetical protein